MHFDLFAFEAEIRTACRARPEALQAEQVRYLAGYLGPNGLKIQTIVVESPYVDRHYIEEYSRYYASSFRPPASSTVRMHFFAEALTDEQIVAAVTTAAGGGEQRQALEDRLQASYRGYVVVRPLPYAPIGRSVLAVYSDKASRRFTVQPHRVHLMGLEFIVDGVPFQQQEVAVGACATTAMWSALAVVSRATGSRGPTPYQITEAATRHILTDRAIPADAGLDLQQSLAAVRDRGFTPLTLKASATFPVFSHSLKCYLASGIPVVLLLHESTGYHAVTAVGFRAPDAEVEAEFITYRAESVAIRTTGMTRLYVHDDRLGPYARMIWGAASDEDAPTLNHEPYAHESSVQSSRKDEQVPMTVYAAIVPLYPKLRLTPRGLLAVAADTLPLMRKLVTGPERESLRVELRFMLSGEYIADLLVSKLDDPARVATFAREAALPRYVGIVRFFAGDGAIGDVVCDTTDIYRDQPKYGSILTLIPLLAAYEPGFRKFTEAYLRP